MQDSKFYIVEQGQLQCHRRAGQGDRHMVKQLDEGAWFGELALLTKTPRQADVTTTTRVKVCTDGITGSQEDTLLLYTVAGNDVRIV